MRAIFKLAVAEGYAQRDPSVSLYIPKEAKTEPTRAMTVKEVEPYIAALNMRERVIAHLAIFAGMRPGEILGLQRQHISEDCTAITIAAALLRRHRHPEDELLTPGCCHSAQDSFAAYGMDVAGRGEEGRVGFRIREPEEAGLA